jgi:hypothetical protein
LGEEVARRFLSARYSFTFSVHPEVNRDGADYFSYQETIGAANPWCERMKLDEYDIFYDMKTGAATKLKDGVRCKVIGGTHEGKYGIVKDIKTGKTGHVSITVVQPDGVKFKTLAKNVTII